MSNVIIETKDGALYSVVESDFKKHYPDVAYKVIGDETPADFVVTGVPRAVKRAGARRKTSKASKPAVVNPVVSPIAETAAPGE